MREWEGSGLSLRVMMGGRLLGQGVAFVGTGEAIVHDRRYCEILSFSVSTAVVLSLGLVVKRP